MNVEQLIEDGRTAWVLKTPLRELTTKNAFEAGVRHALAALFPVVKVEELVTGIYAAKNKNGETVYLSVERREFDQKSYSYGSWSAEQIELEKQKYPKFDIEMFGYEYCKETIYDFTEFRRCPTPGEIGMGGEG